MTTAKVSVLMPVYNAGAHLPAAVESILGQTMREFEFMILDDGSTDESVAYLASLRDPRVRLVRSERNFGLIATLNRGAGLCRAPLIARMDQDDVAEPERLDEQWKAMESDPETAILGTDFTCFGAREEPGWVRFFDAEDLRIALLFENPMCHPTVMLRRAQLPEPLYPAEYKHAEDYALWVQAAAGARLKNLPKKLLRYRLHEGQTSRRHTDQQVESIRRLVLGQLAAIGLSPTRGELYVHQSMAHGFLPAPGAAGLMKRWTDRLLLTNKRTGAYPHELFQQRLRERREASLRQTTRQLQSMPWFRRFRWQFQSLRWARNPLSP